MADETRSLTVAERAPIEVPRAWERQPGEPEEAWCEFLKYRNQPLPRSMRRMGVSIMRNRLVEYAQRYNWPERCAQMDRHFDAILTAEREEIARTVGKEIGTTWALALARANQLLLRELEKVAASSEASELPGPWKPRDLAALMEVIGKYTRLQNGESTENVAVAARDLSRLSPDELMQMRRMRAKLAGDSGDPGSDGRT